MEYKLAITKKVLQEYIDILPVSYYLKHKIEVGITDNEFSYFDLKEKKIMVSIKQLNNIKYKKEPSPKDIEKDIRCMLYHEVSHAIMTPTEKPIIRQDVLNVFEDERIETLLSKYFVNVNFKQFVKKINNYKKGDRPKNAYELFYRIVRFREGPDEFVRKVNPIIYQARYLTSNQTVHWINGRKGLYYSYKKYQQDVYRLYIACEKYFNENFDEEKSNSKMVEETKPVFAPTPTPTQQEEEQNKIEIEETPKDFEKDENEKHYNAKRQYPMGMNQYEDFCREFGINEIAFGKDLDNFVADVVGKHKNEDFPSFRKLIKPIILRYKGSMKQNGGSRTSYSGRLNPRLTINKDFKWFEKNGGTSIRRGIKLQLNLFIDTSASFYRNQKKVNKMLFELDRLEMELPNLFEYNVISMGTSINIKDKKNRRIDCCGGTIIQSTWKKTIDKVQNPNNDNINIALFDGKCYEQKTKQYFRIFNRNNFIIIAEEGNQAAIKQYCKNVRKALIVRSSDNGSYTKLLEDNIIKVLNNVIR